MNLLETHSRYVSMLSILRKKYQHNFDQVTSAINSFQEQQVNLTKTSEAFRELQGLLSLNSKDYLEEFLTGGLRTVVHDRNLTVRILVSDRATRKTAEIFIDEKLGDREISRCISKGGVGGGVRLS